ncbi:hypothetical protein HDU77_007289 [Chytriomyces hyalinus]|nr:hypothetical protein HDU77_007289 [Chytriomyces hyalinus]
MSATMASWRLLKPSWSWAVYLVAVSLGIAQFVFVNAGSSILLVEILNVPNESLGDKTGTLSFADQIVSILSVWPWGVVSDRIGRRTVYAAGFALMGIALISSPFVPSYGALVGLRLVFALGGGAAVSMLAAVLADYASDAHRGKLAGLVGLASGLGALFALFVYLPVTVKYGDLAKGVRIAYLIAGSVSAVFSVLLFLLLTPVVANTSGEKPELTAAAAMSENIQQAEEGLPRSDASATALPADETSTSWKLSADTRTAELAANIEAGRVHQGNAQRLEVSPKKSLWQIASEGLQAAKQDPKVALGYVGSFLARGDTVIITLFIPLWVYQRSIELGTCTVGGGVNDPTIKSACASAYSRAYMISGICQTAALLGAPLFGYLCDRISGVNVVLLNAVIGCGFYFWMFAADPMKNIVIFIVILVGLSEIGLVIGNLALVTNNESIDPSIRGSVAGISSVCGSIGILMTSKLGGYLFDKWNNGAPFFVLAIGHLIALLFGAHTPAPEHIDLATETGEVVDLFGKPKEYAKKYLEARGNYILVKLVGDENDGTYVPLLDQVGEKIKFGLLNPTRQQKAALAATSATGAAAGVRGKGGVALSTDKPSNANAGSSNQGKYVSNNPGGMAGSAANTTGGNTGAGASGNSSSAVTGKLPAGKQASPKGSLDDLSNRKKSNPRPSPIVTAPVPGGSSPQQSPIVIATPVSAFSPQPPMLTPLGGMHPSTTSRLSAAMLKPVK